MRDQVFDDVMLTRVKRAVPPSRVIQTLAIGRPNSVIAVDRTGVRVETERSTDKGTGPQLVPAWMIITAWAELQRLGRVSNHQIRNELNVKRSAFVCALLARFPEVEVESVRPIVLRLRGAGAS